MGAEASLLARVIALLPSQSLGIGQLDRRVIRRQGRLPPSLRPPSFFRRRWLQIVLSVAAVTLLLLPSSYIDRQPQQTNRGAQALSTPTGLPPGDWPANLPANQFAPPDNITNTGNFSSFSLASGVEGGSPVFNLLYVQATSNGHSLLQLQKGSYGPTQAYQILTGAVCASGGRTCFHHSEVWSPVTTILNSSSSITGATIIGYGPSFALAYVVQGVTYVEFSSDGGTTWSLQGHLTGSNPVGYASSTGAAFSVISAGDAYVYSEPWSCTSPATTASTIAAQNASPVYFANGQLSLVVSNSGTRQIDYYLLNSARTQVQSSHTIATWAPNSTSGIFDRIGQTELATPGGYPGQITATALNSTVFVLYTTSVGGRVVAATAVSSITGGNWEGPYLSYPPIGAVQDPQIVIPASGDPEVAWRSTDNGTWEEQLSTYAPDGRLLVGPNSLPASGGLPGTAALSTSFSIDAWGRPYLAWLAQAPGGDQIDYSGGDSPAASVASSWLLATQDLHVLDFKGASQISKTSLVGQVLAIQGDLKTGAYSTAVSSIESTIYPELTLTPLVLDCDSAVPYAACTTITPTSAQLLLTPVTGTSAPSNYLALYAVWTLEAMGIAVQLPVALGQFPYSFACGSQQLPLVLLGPTGSLPPPSGPNPPVTPFLNMSVSGATLEARAVPYNPKNANLSVAFAFPTNTTSHTEKVSGCSQNLYHCAVTFCNTSGVSSWSLTVGLSASYQGTLGGSKTFAGSTNLSAIHLTNLTFAGATYWKLNATGHVTSLHTVSSGWGCADAKYGTVIGYSNISFTPAAWGVVYTTLNLTTPAPTQLSSTSIRASWSTNQLALSWFNFTSGSPHPGNQANSSPLQYVAFLATGLGSGYYNFTEAGDSQRGLSPTPPFTGVSFGNSANNGRSKAASVTREICGLGSDPLAISWPSVVGGPNTTTSNATVVWYNNIASNGSVSVSEYGQTSAAVITGVSSTRQPNGTFESVAEIHDLLPWTIYNVSIWASITKCGIQYVTSAPTLSLTTSAAFGLVEFDYPYDSITKEGGGASVVWSLFYEMSATATFVNGSLEFWPIGNKSAVQDLPFTSAPYIHGAGYAELGGENFTPTTPNSSYSVEVWLNYSLNSHPATILPATSWVTNFTYLRDTSGDGLTDAEKTSGWSVITTNAAGSFRNRTVVANPRLVATNGLVSDYVEKEFGLDPTSVDSASSHMLDTWNLTFNLGLASTNPTAPTGSSFHYWYANSTYNPFASCPYPEAPPCTGYLQGANQNLTNLTSSPNGGPWGDSSPWAAEVFWARSQLSVFDNLSAVQSAGWLRAVLGTYAGYRTLTVWGKLSWGANPLATSTPDDGVADGARVNPLYDEDLNVNFNNLGGGLAGSFGIQSCGSNLPKNSAVALQFGVSGATGGYSGNNYSIPLVLFFCTSGTGSQSYNLTIPVSNILQSERITIGLVANVSTGNSPSAYLLPVNGCQWQYNLTVGMLNGTPERTGNSATYVLTGNPNKATSCAGGASTALQFGASEVPAGLKVRTWVWVPDGNTTLSSLPWGLKRYTAEQSFVLVTINDTNPVLAYQSDAIPLPWGGNASGLTFAPGLSQILIPREQFLNSSLGEAVVLNRTIPNASRIFGPLLGGNQGGGAVNGSSAGTLANLACYWQNRAVSGHPPLCPGGFGGTAANATATLEVLDSSTWSSTNAGGLPSSPEAESGSRAVPAITFALTLNVSHFLVGSQVQQLDALLAGIVDNSTGGVNGTLVDITTRTSSLAFEPAVLTALANQTYPAAGNFGPPISQILNQQQQNPVGQLRDCWNAAACLLYLSGTWLGASFSNPLAAGLFIILAASELDTMLHLNLASRIAGALAAAGQAIVAAVKAIESYASAAIQWILSPVVNPIKSCVNLYSQSLSKDLNQSYTDQGGTGTTSHDVYQFWADFDGCLFVLVLSLGVAAVVVATLATPLDIGADVVGDLLIAMLGGVLLSAAILGAGTGLNNALVDAVQSFLSHIPHLCSIFTSTQTAETFYHTLSTTGDAAGLLFGVEFVYALKGSNFPIVVATGFLLLETIALVLSLLGWADSSPLLIFLVFIFSGAGFAIAAGKTLAEISEDPGIALVFGLAAILGGIGFAGAIAEAEAASC